MCSHRKMERLTGVRKKKEVKTSTQVASHQLFWRAKENGRSGGFVFFTGGIMHSCHRSVVREGIMYGDKEQPGGRRL